MKGYVKPIIIGVFLFALAFAGFNSPAAEAVTIQELQVQIQALLQQIASLQQQIAQQQGNQGIAWCHTFDKNVRVSDSGIDNTNQSGNAADSDVVALKEVLKKEGLYNSIIEQPGTIHEQLISKVTEFQEKYNSEILAPYGLKRGTGYVGVSTRAKLNRLYGCIPSIQPSSPQPTCQDLWWYDNDHRVCSQKQFCGTYMYFGLKTFSTKSACEADLNGLPFNPSITIISPNGGEQWQIGNTYEIKYSTTNISPEDSVYFYLQKGYDSSAAKIGVNSRLFIGKTLNSGSFNYPVPSSIASWPGVSGNYTIKACATSSCALADESDNNFSIISPALRTPPYCSELGTRSEGWYQSGELIRYEQCKGDYAVCRYSDSRSEGWYSERTGELIKYENCN